ncbi:hypothetical protein NLI96_g867 [Meripilus lineatus]|uniref:Uncharacterized protein n=1 Tax=Meripilus lineatus TaxID=2056292 RepID=A0AAD5VFV7_9APHY|nr:hypothetical protein NLI96_g867 [Physisporinus lineatus]
MKAAPGEAARGRRWVQDRAVTGLKAVRGWWWEQDRTAIMKGWRRHRGWWRGVSLEVYLEVWWHVGGGGIKTVLLQVYLEVRRHVGGGGLKNVLQKVEAGRVTCGMVLSSSSRPTDLSRLSRSEVARGRRRVQDRAATGLKVVRGRWREQDRTAFVQGRR